MATKAELHARWTALIAEPFEDGKMIYDNPDTGIAVWRHTYEYDDRRVVTWLSTTHWSRDGALQLRTEEKGRFGRPPADPEFSWGSGGFASGLTATDLTEAMGVIWADAKAYVEAL